jgi:hypothetical protein
MQRRKLTPSNFGEGDTEASLFYRISSPIHWGPFHFQETFLSKFHLTDDAIGQHSTAS